MDTPFLNVEPFAEFKKQTRFADACIGHDIDQMRLPLIDRILESGLHLRQLICTADGTCLYAFKSACRHPERARLQSVYRINLNWLTFAFHRDWSKSSNIEDSP